MVTVGLLVRLVAKPAKEAEVTAPLREGCRWWNRNRQRWRGSQSALDHRTSAYSMLPRRRGPAGAPGGPRR
jgi:hypothetical protein